LGQGSVGYITTIEVLEFEVDTYFVDIMVTFIEGGTTRVEIAEDCALRVVECLDDGDCTEGNIGLRVCDDNNLCFPNPVPP